MKSQNSGSLSISFTCTVTKDHQCMHDITMNSTNYTMSPMEEAQESSTIEGWMISAESFNSKVDIFGVAGGGFLGKVDGDFLK